MRNQRRRLSDAISLPLQAALGSFHVECWKYRCLFDDGSIVIPVRFLQLYACLKPYPLTQGEALFVLHLITLKITMNEDYLSYHKIASYMNITDKMARRHAQRLEEKRYLKRISRPGHPNHFDLTGLFDSLLATSGRVVEIARTQILEKEGKKYV
jgi:DNA-binding MarR family transcriptional regulator